MIITEVLENNAKLYKDEVSLVEINPTEWDDHKPVTWQEYELIEATPAGSYRHEMTWGEFDEKANRFANLLLSKGVKKGDKVAILLMNCLEWLPIYFGILKMLFSLIVVIISSTIIHFIMSKKLTKI